MYSDEWHKNGYSIEKRVSVFDAVYYRHAYNKEGNLAGVIIDYELADDFHYELLTENWQAFCSRYLNGEDNVQAFRAFLMEKGLESVQGIFAFERALKEANITYQKMAFY